MVNHIDNDKNVTGLSHIVDKSVSFCLKKFQQKILIVLISSEDLIITCEMTPVQFFVVVGLISVGLSIVFGIITGMIAGFYRTQKLREFQKIFKGATYQDLLDYKKDPDSFTLKRGLRYRAGGDIEKELLEQKLELILIENESVIKRIVSNIANGFSQPGVELRRCFKKAGIYIIKKKWSSVVIKALNFGLGFPLNQLKLNGIRGLSVDSYLALIIDELKIKTNIPMTLGLSSASIDIFESSFARAIIRPLSVVATVTPIPAVLAFRFGLQIVSLFTGLGVVGNFTLIPALFFSLVGFLTYIATVLMNYNCYEFVEYVPNSINEHNSLNLKALPETDRGLVVVSHELLDKPNIFPAEGEMNDKVTMCDQRDLFSEPQQKDAKSYYERFQETFSTKSESLTLGELTEKEYVNMKNCEITPARDTKETTHRFFYKSAKKMREVSFIEKCEGDWKELNNKKFAKAKEISASSSPLFRKTKELVRTLTEDELI